MKLPYPRLGVKLAKEQIMPRTIMKNKNGPVKSKVLFEPWALGDLIIAVSVFRKLKNSPIIAFHSKWEKLLRLLIGDIPNDRLIALDFPYTTRQKRNAWDLGTLTEIKRSDISNILNIRGDIRDWYAARRLFRRARINMSGWIGFLARRSRLVNLPYRFGILKVRNRYRAWCDLTGVSFDELSTDYRDRMRKAPINKKIVIHMGAQWTSRQYPQPLKLAKDLEANGFAVILVCGSNDKLPEGVEEHSILRIQDEALIKEIQSAEFVITNDSGPMHLAAILGGRTLALARVSDLTEWSPPEVHFLGPNMPRGYRPHSRYSSDEILPGWPKVPAITEYISQWHMNLVATK